MPLIDTLIDFVENTTARAADLDANFAEIRTKMNTYALFKDVAGIVSVVHSYTARQDFAGGISATGFVAPTVAGPGIFAGYSGGESFIHSFEYGGGAPGYKNLAIRAAVLDVRADTRHRFMESSAERGRIEGGRFLWGTTVTAGASAGDMAMGNGKYLRGTDLLGTTNLPLIGVDNSNRTYLGLNNARLYIDGAGLSAGSTHSAWDGYIQASLGGTNILIPYRVG